MISQRGAIFIGLNVVRVLSLIALILVFASSILVMVHDITAVNDFNNGIKAMGASPEEFLQDCDYIEDSTVPNQAAGVFWAVVNRLFIIFQVILLFLSEVSYPMTFFNRYFPVLGSNFGLGPLGIFQGLIGATILSHHTDDFTLVAAFFLFSLGCLNMLLGLIFRGSARARRSVTEWRNEGNGVLPKLGESDGRPRFMRPVGGVANMFNNEKTTPTKNISDVNAFSKGNGFGRQAEKSAGLRGYLITKPIESLPRYASAPPSNRQSSARNSRSSNGSSLYEAQPGSQSTQHVPRFKSSPTAL